MKSCAWMNGQYQQVGPPSQSSQAAPQLTHDTMWNQQAGIANNWCQYRTLNTDVRPPQSAHVTFRNGAYSNRQTSNWQTSSVPHQAVSSQQPAGGETNNCYLKLLLGNLQNSFTNMQNGNPHLLVTSGQVATQQDFHPNSATSLPHEQGFCTSTLVSDTAHNRQTAHNQNHRQNGTQHKFSPSIPPRSYDDHMAVSQSFSNKSITTTSSLNEQILYISSMSQNKTPQEYPIHLNSKHNNGEEATRRFLSKTNELSVKPAADTHEQMLSRQKIVHRIADDLHKSFTASSDSCPPAYSSSPYRGKQFVSEVRMMESNQNMQPVTLTVTESYNSNAFQSLPLNSGPSFPKTSHRVMSRTQHSVDAPQQSSVPNVFHVTATGDGSGNGSKYAPLLKSDRVSKGNLVGSLNDASQLMNWPESISSQKNKTEPSVANNRELLKISEMLSLVKANDRSIYSSPGRTGTRAFAVVQPLSQESYQVGSKHISSNMINQFAEHPATNESLSNPEKLFIPPAVAKNKKPLYLREGSNLPLPENPNQMTSNKSLISHSEVSNDCTLVSSSDLAGHQDLLQKQFCADNRGSDLAINMQVDQQAAPTAQQSVTSKVPVSHGGNKDKSENLTDPKTQVFELSSVPTIPWTAVTLNKLTLDAEKAQVDFSRDSIIPDSKSKLLNMFWDGNINALACKLSTGWYEDLITNVKDFTNKHLTSDSVILSQIKDSFGNQLKSYHVLKDDEVYSELPYKSSWLNVNEQLDDIDKEFGFPWSSKHCLYMLESHTQSHQVETVNSNHAQIVSEVLNKVVSQTEIELVDSCEEKQASTVKATSTQAASPNETESADSSDPYYSFEIQVLPPEEARVIFERVKSKMLQSMDTDTQPERVMNSSVKGEPPEDIDVTLNDSKLENESVCPIQQVCCILRWMEIINGPNTSLSKCQCQDEQSLKERTDETLDKEEMAVQKEDDLRAITYYSKLHMEGENQAKGGENIDFRVMTYSLSDLGNEPSQTIALTENEHKPLSHSDEEPKNISQTNINSSQSSIILVNENKDSLSSSDTEIQSDPGVDCGQGQIKSTGSTLSCTSVSSDKKNENLPCSESEVVSQMSDLEEDCEKAQLTSTDVGESSLETEISTMAALQITLSLSGKHETVERKPKRQSSHDRFFPFLKKSNKCKPPVDVDSQPSTCREVLMDATDSEPIASNATAVQLVLFGSAPQDKYDLIDRRRRHNSSLRAVYDGEPRPPEVLSVSLNPLRRKYSETVPTEERSVKQRIHEKWRRSLPPAEIRCKSKLKTQKYTFASLSGVSLKKAEMVGTSNPEKLPVSSEMRICNRNTKCCLSLKRRRSLSDGFKRGEEKMKKGAVTLKQPAEQKRSNAENGSLAVMPVQDNNILRFSVLPSTFNFKDGSNRGKEIIDPVTNKPTLVEGNDKSPNKTITREMGTWYPNPEKKNRPLCSPPVPKTSSVFHMFQKKYMEKTQPSMDK